MYTSSYGTSLYGLAVSETQIFAVAADIGAIKIWNKDDIQTEGKKINCLFPKFSLSNSFLVLFFFFLQIK